MSVLIFFQVIRQNCKSLNFKFVELEYADFFKDFFLNE